MALGRKDWFQIDPKPIYLAHGSFGGCFSVAYENRLSWYEKLEKNPHNFLVNELFDELKESRKALADYLNCDFNSLVYFPNPSTALNTVIRSLDLNENDEVLTSNHEYGALDKTWNFYSEKRGFKYKKVKIDIPYDEENFFIESFKKSITKKTKVIFLSHITSSTALIFPVEKICKIAKDNNILIIIDGAHAPADALNLYKYLKTIKFPLYGIWAMSKNKEPDEFIKNLKGIFKKIVTIPIKDENSVSAKELNKIANKNKIKSEAAKDFKNALKKISSNEKKLICCFGSLYFISNILNKN